MWKSCNILTKSRALLLSLFILQVVCADDLGASEDDGFVSSRKIRSISPLPDTEETTTNNGGFPSLPTFPTTTAIYDGFSSIYDIGTGKMIVLLLVSFTIPAGFMILLFWRLQKEKKYLNASAGALVYRDTVLVPSYTNSNDANINANSNTANVIQMHTTLYDTPPPEYEEVVDPLTPNPTPADNSEYAKSKDCKTDDAPPPSYSTLHI